MTDTQQSPQVLTQGQSYMGGTVNFDTATGKPLAAGQTTLSQPLPTPGTTVSAPQGKDTVGAYSSPVMNSSESRTLYNRNDVTFTNTIARKNGNWQYLGSDTCAGTGVNSLVQTCDTGNSVSSYFGRFGIVNIQANSVSAVTGSFLISRIGGTSNSITGWTANGGNTQNGTITSTATWTATSSIRFNSTISAFTGTPTLSSMTGQVYFYR